MGRPKKPTRTKFPIDIDKEILEKAKKKFPKLHAIVVNFIRELSESDPLEGEQEDY